MQIQNIPASTIITLKLSLRTLMFKISISCRVDIKQDVVAPATLVSVTIEIFLY